MTSVSSPGTQSEHTDAVLRATGLCKDYGGRRVLHDVDFDVRRGRVNVLLGANGAGKSTLMKLLSGIERPSSGRITIDGVSRTLDSPRAAERAGIGIVHQELGLFHDLSVTDNLFMGRERTRYGLLAEQVQEQTARELLAQLKLAVEPSTLVGELPLGQQQLVEIARALALNARVLFLDEPTSALSASEVATLFDVLQNLKERGVSLVYVSHRLDELFRIGDFITVLRDGSKVADAEMSTIDASWIVEKMLGRKVNSAQPAVERSFGDEILRVEGLTVPRPGGGSVLNGVTLTVCAGEVLGLYGLMGAGRTELLETIAGLRKPRRGRLLFRGKPLAPEDVRARIRRGVVLVPEDRKGQGLVLELSVRENVTLSSLKQVTRWAWLDPRREAEPVQRYTATLALRASSPEQPVVELSGGNQQKVVLARALLAKPALLLLDEPTRGIDIAAKAEIVALIRQLAAQGMAIVVASSEAQELLDCADRILVLSKGREAALLPRAQATESALIRAAGSDVLPATNGP